MSPQTAPQRVAATRAAAPATRPTRWVLLAVLVAALVLPLVAFSGRAEAQQARPGTAAVTREDAIHELDQVRASIDDTLELLDSGQRDLALSQAQDGYLYHFELVEIPLQVVDLELKVQAEGLFAEIRGMIEDGAPTAEIRTKLIELRGVLEESERRLTDVGLGAPAIMFSQGFLIIFREGLEVVLLLSVLLGYLKSAKATGDYKRPVLIGVGLAIVASAITLVLLQTVFARLPVSREILEAVTSLVASAILFWVSFSLIQRLDHKRWMEFLKSRVWRAVAVGSSASLILLGFTAVYREGFETALFYQALLSFGTGMTPWLAAGFATGVAALAAVTWVIFRVGRKLPVTTFLKIALVLVMITSVAFFGNAVHALQEAFVVGRTPIDVPRLPIFLSQATGFWPTAQTVIAQAVLVLLYLGAALYGFVIRPRRNGPPASTPAPVDPAVGSESVASVASSSSAAVTSSSAPSSSEASSPASGATSVDAAVSADGPDGTVSTSASAPARTR
jgi:high-affinity iron transporter